MTEPEIIDAILKTMRPEQHYRFYDEWRKASQADLYTARWRHGAERILKQMLSKKLISVIRSEGDEVIVRLVLKETKVSWNIPHWIIPRKIWFWFLGGIGTIALGLIVMIAYDWRPNWVKNHCLSNQKFSYMRIRFLPIENPV